MKMKHHTGFKLQNKFLKNMFIYYNYQLLKILIMNSHSHHYLIEDFIIFMTNKLKYHGKNHFCQYCLECFSSSQVL